jgi:hypothetical protein
MARLFANGGRATGQEQGFGAAAASLILPQDEQNWAVKLSSGSAQRHRPSLVRCKNPGTK